MTKKKNMNFPDFSFEQQLWNSDYEYIIGVDEVGRGCFAGPVVVGAVAFAKDCMQEAIAGLGIHDSKQLKHTQRKRLVDHIKNVCAFSKVAEVGVSTINKVGIGKATTMAMRKAVSSLFPLLRERVRVRGTSGTSRIFILVDAFKISHLNGVGLKHQKGIIKGDQKSISIASASIIAKVYRDTLMVKLAKQHPQYGWGRNKGYGTKEHQEAIIRHGTSKHHRTAFVTTFLRHNQNST